ncbi:formimidoylglutamate deiminase [Salipiger sp. 1_MG-2023]|uniref:formimidoylglutamate deiminase n=1 Tax=Salipiger sp. 1_MG-2023 TaxID=3062665 RepID=UPI0026E35BC3|nr:formimidoylglutamate deiminase [Salipiger sp. 1_MG-2023]MDO6585164.1 formimidoylglutamate deiminase [Salipiger sp. 1_MG-2023]
MIFADKALLPTGWENNVRLDIADGHIGSVEIGATQRSGDARVATLIPGMPNVHSHAFQRGHSGLTEVRSAGRESFWTWREMMYRFALCVSPEDVGTLAEMAYVEMLEAGYTRVGEFHYLHHGKDGTPYDNPAELSDRIFAAAEQTGIALTHLPVFYAHGGFGPQAPGDGQRRFIHSVDRFVELVARCEARLARPQDRVGFAPHSLRATSHEELSALCGALPGRKIHIHISEQVKEVEDCLAFYGQRPVDWLFDHAEVNADWCLIHATHLTASEMQRIAASKAVAGLCPVTEANLGDGLFPAPEFLAADGKIAIGTDSNVRIDVAEELRVLEYGQRLHARARNVLAPEGGSTGRHLFDASLAGGAQALDAPAPLIASGAPADLVALADPLGLGQGDALLDRWIFGRDVAVSDVWAAGAHVVRAGRHIHRDAVQARFADVLRHVLT